MAGPLENVDDILSRLSSHNDEASAGLRFPTEEVQEAVADIEKHGQSEDRIAETDPVKEKQRTRMTSITRLGGSKSPGQFDTSPKRTRYNTFLASIDLEDTEYMEERLEYDIAWSINPFVHNPYHKKHHGESGGSTPHLNNEGSPGGPALMTVQEMRKSENISKDIDRKYSVDPHALSMFDNMGTPKASYAELFYDLFFVASLTSFGIKHEITQEQAIASYVAFFTVLWWVWTSQSFYDVRFETGDVIHRLFKFAQLLLLAAFAAFAGRFDVYYGFPNDYGLEDDANPFTSDRTSGFFAFRGMTLVYIISRGILALQYLLLYFYARRKAYPASNQFLLQIGALCTSGAMWLGSYFLEGDDATDAMRIAKFGLWYGGIAIEFGMSYFAWLVCRVTGFRRTHLNERFATLTLLILGEGVIGYAIALQGIIGGIGFGAPAGAALVMVCLIIYLLWLLYFSTFDENAQYGVPRAYAWSYLHYPFHVALILILLACNSLMIFANVQNAVNAFGQGDPYYQASILETVYDGATNVTVGETTVTWNYNDLNNGTFLENLTEQQGAVLLFDTLSRIFQSYNLHVPEEFTTTLEELADHQIDASQDTFEYLLGTLALRFYVSAVYYVVASGAFMIFNAGILLVQKWPRDKYAWIGIYTRLIFGAGFICLLPIWPTQAGADYLGSSMLMPSLVIVIVIIVLIDFISTMFAVRQYRRAGKLPPRRLKHKGWLSQVERMFHL